MAGGKSRGPASVTFAIAIALLAGCAAPPPPPKPPAPPPPPAAPPEPAPPTKEPVATGKDCATAEAECAGGVCAVEIKNGCDQPITCDLFLTATCQAQTEMVEARARKRDTFAAKTDGQLSAEAKCTEGDVIHTEVKELACK
jgi:hypothetical protein